MSLTGLEGPLLAGVSLAADCSESQEKITISFALSLGMLADSGELIYPLVVTGKVSLNEIRRIMGEAALLRHIQEPPMKYVLCRENSLADMITNTRALENIEGVQVCRNIPEPGGASLYTISDIP